jgi:prepilin-type N-terminal cleavage/methylation domain-containing protein
MAWRGKSGYSLPQSDLALRSNAVNLCCASPSIAPVQRSRPATGFTLIELLVVLAIVAGLMALVGPPLFNQIARAEERSQRAQILDHIAGLSFKSFQTGRPLALDARRVLESENDIITLPPGWRVEWATPLTINLLGVCSGGRFAIISPADATLQYELAAPFCDEPKEIEPQ